MRKIPNFVPLQTALIDDIRIKRLNKDHLNCSGLGILIGLYFYLLKNPNLTCSYNEIDIIADELRASIPIIITVIERYNLFEIIKDSNGNKFFSPMLNNALEPYFEICETNKIRGQISAEKRKLKNQQKLDELKKLKYNLKDESDGLNSTNVKESNLNKSNSTKSNSSSSCNFSWKNEKNFEEFFNWLKENVRETIKNEKHYKNTLLEKLQDDDSKTLENWNHFIAFKKEEEIIKRIKALKGKCVLLQTKQGNEYSKEYKRDILQVNINESEKSFILKISHEENGEKVYLSIPVEFSSLEMIENKLVKDNSP